MDQTHPRCRRREPDNNEPPLAPSPRSLRGLDWFIFFVADVQTGFGPFVSVYLTTQKWTQVDIGLVLSAAGFVSLIGQMPGGALVDAARSERLVGGLAVAAICMSALGYAAMPIFPMVLSAAVLHSLASCVLGPAIAAISLGLVGHVAIGERLGTQRALRLHRKRTGRCRHGRRRLLSFRARRFRRHRLAARPGAHRVASDRRERDRSGACSRRAAATARRQVAGQARRSDAQPAAPHLCRLSPPLPPRQCRHAAAHGKRG